MTRCRRSLATLEQAMSPSASESNEGRNSWDLPAVVNSAVSGEDPKQKESRTAGVAEETDKEQKRDAKLKIKQAVAATADGRKEMLDLCEKVKKVQESLAAKRFEMDQNSTASATDPATKQRYETQLATLTGQLEGHQQRMSQLRESLREGMELEKEAKNGLKAVSPARLAVFGASGSGSFRQTQNKSSGSGPFRKSVSARSESSPRKAEPLKRSTSLKKP